MGMQCREGRRMEATGSNVSSVPLQSSGGGVENVNLGRYGLPSYGAEENRLGGTFRQDLFRWGLGSTVGVKMHFISFP